MGQEPVPLPGLAAGSLPVVAGRGRSRRGARQRADALEPPEPHLGGQSSAANLLPVPAGCGAGTCRAAPGRAGQRPRPPRPNHKHITGQAINQHVPAPFSAPAPAAAAAGTAVPGWEPRAPSPPLLPTAGPCQGIAGASAAPKPCTSRPGTRRSREAAPTPPSTPVAPVSAPEHWNHRTKMAQSAQGTDPQPQTRRPPPLPAAQDGTHRAAVLPLPALAPGMEPGVSQRGAGAARALRLLLAPLLHSLSVPRESRVRTHASSSHRTRTLRFG